MSARGWCWIAMFAAAGVFWVVAVPAAVRLVAVMLCGGG